MKPVEIKSIENRIIEYLKRLEDVDSVFYDDMQGLIRFNVADYETTISVDYQKMSADVIEERREGKNMDNIKFRGKRIDNGKWELGFLYKSENVCRIITAIAIDKDIDENMWYCEGRDVIPETIGQYTTRNDVNKKEIYQGDKLKFTVFDCFGGDTQYTGYVVWSDTRFMLWNSPDSEYYRVNGGFDLDWVLAQDDEAEVIGNIYEKDGEKV